METNIELRKKIRELELVIEDLRKELVIVIRENEELIKKYEKENREDVLPIF